MAFSAPSKVFDALLHESSVRFVAVLLSPYPKNQHTSSRLSSCSVLIKQYNLAHSLTKIKNRLASPKVRNNKPR